MNTPTQAKHTPGPWQASTDLETSGVPVFAKNKAGMLYYIATCSYMGTADPEPAKANARLIAAAPQLLEALQACITEDGAVAWRSAEMAGRRLEAISNIARAAIQAATPNQ